jgi:hypothetical protein
MRPVAWFFYRSPSFSGQGRGLMDFANVHRSFIVLLKRIERLRNKSIQVAGREIHVGSSYEEDFKKSFLP